MNPDPLAYGAGLESALIMLVVFLVVVVIASLHEVAREKRLRKREAARALRAAQLLRRITKQAKQ